MIFDPGITTFHLDHSVDEFFRRLSFAKNASGSFALCCNAFITVMQTAKMRDLDDPTDARDLPSIRTLLVQPQMSPGPMVVGKIATESPLEMPRVPDNEMVQALSSDRADQAFGVWILPGTPGRREHLFNM